MDKSWWKGFNCERQISIHGVRDPKSGQYRLADPVAETKQNKNKRVHLRKQSRDLEGDEGKLRELQGPRGIKIYKQKYEGGKCNPNSNITMVLW